MSFFVHYCKAPEILERDKRHFFKALQANDDSWPLSRVLFINWYPWFDEAVRETIHRILSFLAFTNICQVPDSLQAARKKLDPNTRKVQKNAIYWDNNNLHPTHEPFSPLV